MNKLSIKNRDVDKASISDLLYVNQLIKERSMLSAAQSMGVLYNSFAKAIQRFEKKLGIEDFFIKNSSEFIVNTKYQSIIDEIKKTVDHYQNFVLLSEKKEIVDRLSLHTSQTIFEAMIVNHIVPFLRNNSRKLLLSINQTDDFSEHNPGYNSLSFVPSKKNDEKKYKYFFYHSFLQKLWASKQCIEHYAGISSLEDIIKKRIPVLLQRCSDPEGTDDVSLIGKRGIFEHFPEDEVNFVPVKGVRSIDILTEQGYGIQAMSEETTRLLNLNVVNVCPKITGELVPLYIKCTHESYKSQNVQVLIDRLLHWKDLELQRLRPSTGGS